MSQDAALSKALQAMGADYRKDPERAVRSQGFIKPLHEYIGNQLLARLTPQAKRAGIRVKYEAKISGSHKTKNVDVSVIDPDNGPLVLVGLRSQMSSVAKNAGTYYEGIIGECISLQERFPMAVHGYVYLMPLRPIKKGREQESIDHARYARWYAAITGREGVDYYRLRGIYDQFAYMVVDFSTSPPVLNKRLARSAQRTADLSIATFVDRLVATFARRMLFRDVFKASPRTALSR